VLGIAVQGLGWSGRRFREAGFGPLYEWPTIGPVAALNVTPSGGFWKGCATIAYEIAAMPKLRFTRANQGST
jgi:hypothetical protein